MKKYFLFIPLAIFCFFIVVFYFRFNIDRDPSELPSVLINQKAPIFETSSLLDNKSFISTEEFGEETIIVNFFATWCLPCREEHSNIQRLSKEKGIKVIGINFKDDSQLAIKWLKELGNPYSIVGVDSDGSIGMDWGVYGLPETFILDTNQIIKYRQVGPITDKKYDAFYNRIIESKK